MSTVNCQKPSNTAVSLPQRFRRPQATSFLSILIDPASEIPPGTTVTMAVTMEGLVGARMQHIREMRKTRFQDTTEANFSGRLKLLMGAATSSKRQCHWVVAQVYPTSAGGMVVFWPDKLYARPIGSFQLKDFIFSETSEQKLGFTLRPKESCDDDLPLELTCHNESDHQRWKTAFTICCGSMADKKFVPSSRLPSLTEE